MTDPALQRAAGLVALGAAVVGLPLVSFVAVSRMGQRLARAETRGDG